MYKRSYPKRCLFSLSYVSNVNNRLIWITFEKIRKSWFFLLPLIHKKKTFLYIRSLCLISYFRGQIMKKFVLVKVGFLSSKLQYFSYIRCSHSSTPTCVGFFPMVFVRKHRILAISVHFLKMLRLPHCRCRLVLFVRRILQKQSMWPCELYLIS